MFGQKNLKEKSVYLLSALSSRIINGKKDPASFSFRNILCIREDQIGDLCYSVHVFASLKKQFPGSQLTLLCKPASAALIKHDPSVDVVLTSWNELPGGYDLIVDLRGSLKSIRYAWSHRPVIRLDRGTVRWKNKFRLAQHPHEIETNLQVIEPLVQSKNRVEQPRIYPGIEENKKVDAFLLSKKIGPFALLHVGARRELRKWPVENFSVLAEYLKTNHQLDVIFCGDASDVELIEAAKKHISFPVFSTAGVFNLAEFAALAARAELFVGNESGPLHIAAVSGAPSLGLFGPGEPHVFYPRGACTAFLHPILECNPCDQVHCIHPEFPCIRRISLEEVKSKVEDLLRMDT